MLPTYSSSLSSRIILSPASEAQHVVSVAFDIGGLKDIVDHKKTGYLAKPFDPIDLANGIIWI